MINYPTAQPSAQPSAHLSTLLANGAHVRTTMRGLAKTKSVQSFGERIAGESAKLRQSVRGGPLSKAEGTESAAAVQRTNQQTNQRTDKRTNERESQNVRTERRDAAVAGESRRGFGQVASQEVNKEPIADELHAAGVKESAAADNGLPVDEEATGQAAAGTKGQDESHPELAALPKAHQRSESPSADVLKAANGQEQAVTEVTATLRTSGDADDAEDVEDAVSPHGTRPQHAMANGPSAPAAPLTITDVNKQMLSMDPRRVLLGLQLPRSARVQAGESEPSNTGAGLPQSGEQSLMADVKAERGPTLPLENSHVMPWAQRTGAGQEQSGSFALLQHGGVAAEPATALPQPLGAMDAPLPTGNASTQSIQSIQSMVASGQQSPMVPVMPAAPAGPAPASAVAQPASTAASVAPSSGKQSARHESNGEGASQDGDRSQGRDAARTQGWLTTIESATESAGSANAANRSGDASAASPEQFSRQMERALLSAARQNERTPSAAKGPVTVRLKPEALGQVRIRLDSTSAALSVRIEVGSTDTRRLLNESMPALVESLRQRGVNIENATVHIDPQLRDGAGDQPGSLFSQANRNASVAGEFDQHANHDASQRGRNRDRQPAHR